MKGDTPRGTLTLNVRLGLPWDSPQPPPQPPRSHRDLLSTQLNLASLKIVPCSVFLPFPTTSEVRAQSPRGRRRWCNAPRRKQANRSHLRRSRREGRGGEGSRYAATQRPPPSPVLPCLTPSRAPPSPPTWTSCPSHTLHFPRAGPHAPSLTAGDISTSVLDARRNSPSRNELRIRVATSLPGALSNTQLVPR